jgi:hypothetical protein
VLQSDHAAVVLSTVLDQPLSSLSTTLQRHRLSSFLSTGPSTPPRHSPLRRPSSPLGLRSTP